LIIRRGSRDANDAAFARCGYRDVQLSEQGDRNVDLLDDLLRNRSQHEVR
jgi:hypothetical protein